MKKNKSPKSVAGLAGAEMRWRTLLPDLYRETPLVKRNRLPRSLAGLTKAQLRRLVKNVEADLAEHRAKSQEIPESVRKTPVNEIAKLPEADAMHLLQGRREMVVLSRRILRLHGVLHRLKS